MRLFGIIGSVLMVLSAAGSRALGQQLTFTTIDVPGAFATQASRINNGGQIVGTFDAPPVLAFDGNLYPGMSRGFLLSSGVFTTIDGPSGGCFWTGFCTDARGINTPGQVVGASDFTTWIFGWYFMQGFLLSGGTFTTINFPGAFATQASAINDAGQIVGTFVDPPYLSDDWVTIPGMSHGFLLSEDGFTTVEPPSASASDAFAINAAGQIVGTFSDDLGVVHGFLLTRGTFTTIDAPGGGETRPSWLNATGNIVGSFSDGTGTHGFLLSDGVFTTLDVPGALDTWASWINATGQIVGNFRDAASVSHGFSLSGGVFTTIEPDGAFGSWASGINDAGQIVGSFTDSSSVGHGFLASPPEVGTGGGGSIDTTPPTVTITAPTSGSTVNGAITLSGTASE